jgi:futalosine hydrolase
MDRIALVCAAGPEAAPIRSRLTGIRTLGFPRDLAVEGVFAGSSAVLLVAGMGKTNAAHALTLLLERERIDAVIGFGIGGAYDGSGLEVGDIAVATREHYGDEGVETPDGWMSCEGIGIPLLVLDSEPHFNDVPVDAEGALAVLEALRECGIRCAAGPFVTVSTCSGTAARGARLAQRHAAICESMEGAAYAHVAALHATPFLEVRGISNLVEDRDFTRWRITAAAEAVAQALTLALPRWRTHRSLLEPPP